MSDDGQIMWRIDPGRGYPLDEDEIVVIPVDGDE